MVLWLASLTPGLRNVKIELVNQWLTALQSIAIIAGVIVAIWQLSAISEQNKIQGQTLKISGTWYRTRYLLTKWLTITSHPIFEYAWCNADVQRMIRDDRKGDKS